MTFPSLEGESELAFMKNPQNMASEIERANAGDANAARRLWRFHSIIDLNPRVAEYWMSRAADLGDASSEIDYGVSLYKKGGSKNCALASAYLKDGAEREPAYKPIAGAWADEIRHSKACVERFPQGH